MSRYHTVAQSNSNFSPSKFNYIVCDRTMEGRSYEDQAIAKFTDFKDAQEFEDRKNTLYKAQREMDDSQRQKSVDKLKGAQ